MSDEIYDELRKELAGALWREINKVLENPELAIDKSSRPKRDDKYRFNLRIDYVIVDGKRQVTRVTVVDDTTALC